MQIVSFSLPYPPRPPSAPCFTGNAPPPRADTIAHRLVSGQLPLRLRLLFSPVKAAYRISPTSQSSRMRSPSFAINSLLLPLQWRAHPGRSSSCRNTSHQPTSLPLPPPQLAILPSPPLLPPSATSPPIQAPTAVPRTSATTGKLSLAEEARHLTSHRSHRQRLSKPPSPLLHPLSSPHLAPLTLLPRPSGIPNKKGYTSSRL